MELNIAGAVASIVCTADGSTSLYLSTGGGLIGCGLHENVRQVSELFLVRAKEAVEFMTADENHSPPGEVCFFVKTGDGFFRYCAREKDLQEKKDKLSRLYFLGHMVLAEMRKTASE